MPKACRLLYWDGNGFVPVPEASGLGVELNKFNTTTFPEITTSKAEAGNGRSGCGVDRGVLEWRVYDSGEVAQFSAGGQGEVDRIVVLPGKTYLNARFRDDGKTAKVTGTWSKASGPGEVKFDDAGTLLVRRRGFRCRGNIVAEIQRRMTETFQGSA